MKRLCSGREGGGGGGIYSESNNIISLIIVYCTNLNTSVGSLNTMM